MNHWREALRRGVQFSETTKCRTVEIFHRAGVAEADWIESPVDDVTLPQWLDTVRATGDEAPQTKHLHRLLHCLVLIETAVRLLYRD